MIHRHNTRHLNKSLARIPIVFSLRKLVQAKRARALLGAEIATISVLLWSGTSAGCNNAEHGNEIVSPCADGGDSCNGAGGEDDAVGSSGVGGGGGSDGELYCQGRTPCGGICCPFVAPECYSGHCSTELECFDNIRCGDQCCDPLFQDCRESGCVYRCHDKPLCEEGQSCSAEGECLDMCLIDGNYRAQGTNKFGNICEVCAESNLSDWTIDRGAPCEDRHLCNDIGNCVLAVSVSAGTQQTCAVQNGGKTECWGINDYGRPGDSTAESSAVPKMLLGIGIATSVSTSRHGCTLSANFGALCWGANEFGQLGNGTTIDSSDMVNVSDLDPGVIAISTGEYHTCAITSAKEVMCWGLNNNGQLGDGTNNNSSTPKRVTELGAGVVAISTGYAHSCAITSTGELKCWGSNNAGQLGDGTRNDSNAPMHVIGLESDVVAVSAGFRHTCAVFYSGEATCWGANGSGQLGDGTTVERLFPPEHPVGLESSVVAISAGVGHTCATTVDGDAMCWGANLRGQLGTGTTDNHLVPAQVVRKTEGGFLAISAGYDHTCAIHPRSWTETDMYCWGANEFGQIGDGTYEDRHDPTLVKWVP